MNTIDLRTIEREAHALRAAYIGRLIRDVKAALKTRATGPVHGGQPFNA